MQYNKLLDAAKKAMKNAYCPYSRFKVGAALLTKGGKVYTGTNIENASYGLTNCAERTAVYKAVSEGEKKFTALAVVSSGKRQAYPCGACLQVMREFSRDIDIITGTKHGKYRVKKISELLPMPFDMNK